MNGVILAFTAQTRIISLFTVPFLSFLAVVRTMNNHGINEVPAPALVRGDPPALNAPNPEFVCVVCSKHFRNNKALGGHMRVHPNCSWRGILPPLPDLNNVPAAPVERI